MKKTITLIEPQQENGVFTFFMQLSTYKPEIFPFTVIDYDTHFGIDVIVKAKDNMPIKSSQLFYVEFKNYLSKNFNHSFENLHSIVCWDINSVDLKNEEEVCDIANQRRTLKIVPPEQAGDYTRYYFDSLRSDRKIEVFVLKYYLEENLVLSLFQEMSLLHFRIDGRVNPSLYYIIRKGCAVMGFAEKNCFLKQKEFIVKNVSLSRKVNVIIVDILFGIRM